MAEIQSVSGSMKPDGAPLLLARWLLMVAALVFAMVVVGGITRLTGSGLSITALVILGGLIWTALDLRLLAHHPGKTSRLGAFGICVLAVLFIELLLGAFMAGLKAGHGGYHRLVPPSRGTRNAETRICPPSRVTQDWGLLKTRTKKRGFHGRFTA